MIDLGESRFYLLRHSFSLKHKHVEHRRNPLPEMDAVRFQGKHVHLLKHYCIIMFLVRMKIVSSSLAVFGITFRSRTRTAKSNEQLENGCLLVKFWKPFVNLFPPSDGRGNFGAFSTCSRRKNHFPYRTRKIPNSAIMQKKYVDEDRVFHT